MTSVQVRVPSNIALIKYWGKADVEKQWPASDSLSMTLKNAYTETQVSASSSKADEIVVKNLADDKTGKVRQHLDFLRRELGFSGFLKVVSENSFPTGCGIASSASGLGALTLAAIGYWTESNSFEDLEKNNFSRERLAQLARLGSGSAGRSMMEGFVEWKKGESPAQQTITSYKSVDHWALADLIVVVSGVEKSVSSSQAHLAAWESPLFATRLAGVSEKMLSVKESIQNRDVASLGAVIEAEAIEMHSVMMTGEPRVNFWTKDTENFLVWLRNQRNNTGLPAWFTIDAGPNVHVMCEQNEQKRVRDAIQAQFPHFEILEDEVGCGPMFINKADSEECKGL